MLSKRLLFLKLKLSYARADGVARMLPEAQSTPDKTKNDYTTADGGFCYQRVNRHLIKEKWKKPDMDPCECR